jgi:hypothetical protein
MQQTPQSAGNATVNEAGSGTLSGYRECCSLNFEERSEQSENVVIWVGKVQSEVRLYQLRSQVYQSEV